MVRAGHKTARATSALRNENASGPPKRRRNNGRTRAKSFAVSVGAAETHIRGSNRPAARSGAGLKTKGREAASRVDLSPEEPAAGGRKTAGANENIVRPKKPAQFDRADRQWPSFFPHHPAPGWQRKVRWVFASDAAGGSHRPPDSAANAWVVAQHLSARKLSSSAGESQAECRQDRPR